MEKEMTSQKSLFDAIRNGDFEKVKKCVENGAEVNGGLALACEKHRNDISVYLIEKGAKVNSSEGQAEHNAFLKACYNGDVELAKSLINAGVDVNKRAVTTGWVGFPSVSVKVFSVKHQAILAGLTYNHMEIVKLVLVNAGEVDKAKMSDETLKALVEAWNEEWASTLIQEKRPRHVWSENPKMKIYAGRRLRSEEVANIMTRGTVLFVQSHIHNDPCFYSSESEVWQGGLLIKRTINDRSIEGMILLQDCEKAIDFIVRGPEHSEGECKTLLDDLMAAGKNVLQKRNSGTNLSLWYISSSELKKLKDDARAHKLKTVDDAIEIPEQSTRATVHKEGIEDSLEDLLALPDDHFTFLPYETRCIISKCLKKDSDGRKALAKVLLPKSGDRLRCDSAEQLLAIWSTYLKATTKRFADAARASGLLYLLIILRDCGAIKLCKEENKKAQEDLTFFEANSPPEIAARRRFLSDPYPTMRTQMAATAIRPRASRPLESDYLDAPPTLSEIMEVVEHIWPVLRDFHIRLRPLLRDRLNAFILACVEERVCWHEVYHRLKRCDRDWDRDWEGDRFTWRLDRSTPVTRRRLIDAMESIGCSDDAAKIFSGPPED